MVKLLTSILLLATISRGQDATKPDTTKFYKLDLAVKQLEAAKVINARYYSVIITVPDSREKTEIRTGNRLPILINANDWQAEDLGTDFDIFNARDLGDALALHVSAKIVGLVADAAITNPTHPTTRHNEWSSTVVVPLRKQTTIFSSDDPGSKQQMQVELTATPIR